MQTPYEIGDTLWLVYSWEEVPIEAKVSMMTIKADKTWKIRVSYNSRYGKSLHEVKLEDINKFKGNLYEDYDRAAECLQTMKEFQR